MAMSLDAAAEVFREAMRDTVKRYSLRYLIQGLLLALRRQHPARIEAWQTL